MSKKIKQLSREEKLWAVQEYLEGKGSSYSIADKYGVTDTAIRRWVDQYRVDGDAAFQRSSRSVPLTPEEKLHAVHAYLEGKATLRELTLKYHVGGTSIRKWISKYQAGGDAALQPIHTKKHYSQSLKREVIQAYLSGDGSFYELAVRFKISSFETIRKWILQYNGCSNIKGSGSGGAATMGKGRKTTYEERLEIVSFCIENNYDYHLAAEKHQVSYQQVYSWVRKYKSQGVESLKDRRGRIKPETEMTELEKLCAENRILKAKNKQQQMEIDFLKKLDEIERRRD